MPIGELAKFSHAASGIYSAFMYIVYYGGARVTEVPTRGRLNKGGFLDFSDMQGMVWGEPELIEWECCSAASLSLWLVFMSDYQGSLFVSVHFAASLLFVVIDSSALYLLIYASLIALLSEQLFDEL